VHVVVVVVVIVVVVVVIDVLPGEAEIVRVMLGRP
jgi:hypothetical protein